MRTRHESAVPLLGARRSLDLLREQRLAIRFYVACDCILMTENRLSEILNCPRLTAIVDVGASSIDGPPPYRAMLDAGLCTVVGFDPNVSAIAELNAAKGPNETYLPNAIGYGGMETLRKFDADGLNSLMVPDPAAMSAFPGFARWSTELSSEQVKTTRLVDIPEARPMDMIKIDIQGGELAAFHSAEYLMDEVLCVHTEVSFVPLYLSRATFGEIDIELRRHGLVPHMFAEVKKWLIAPTIGTMALNQLLEADVVYVRDFTKMDAMSDDQLKHLAMIAHYCYGSTDLAVRCLVWLAKRGAVAEGSAQKYLSSL